jgi:hypothetical protein
MSTKPLKAFAQFYKEIELVAGTGEKYLVRTKFNDHFNDEAFRLAINMCKKEIFESRYEKAPLVSTGNEEEDARTNAMYTPEGWVTLDEVKNEFPDMVLFKRIETAKIVLACTPIDKATPIEDIISFIDDDKLEELRRFFTNTKLPAPQLQEPKSPRSPRTSKKNGRAPSKS